MFDFLFKNYWRDRYDKETVKVCNLARKVDHLERDISQQEDCQSCDYRVRLRPVARCSTCDDALRRLIRNDKRRYQLECDMDRLRDEKRALEADAERLQNIIVNLKNRVDILETRREW